MRAARFQKDRPARVAERRHERERRRLQQRFPARHLHQRTVKSQRGVQHVRKRPARAFRERIRRIAIRAAQIARRQPHEDARQPGPGALPLEREENLVDGQLRLHRGNMNQGAGESQRFS